MVKNTFVTQSSSGSFGTATYVTLSGSSVSSFSNDVNANNFKLTNLANPTNPQDATMKAYIDSNLPTAGTNLNKVGNVLNLNSDISVNSVSLTLAPSSSANATTKTYVDNAVNSISAGSGFIKIWQYLFIIGKPFC